MRLILLVVLIVAVVWAIRRALRAATRGPRAERPPVPGELVSCARCGLHLPRTEARESDGQLFCTDEHARLGVAPKG